MLHPSMQLVLNLHMHYIMLLYICMKERTDGQKCDLLNRLYWEKSNDDTDQLNMEMI